MKRGELELAAQAGVDFVINGTPHYELILSPEDVRKLLSVGRDAYMCERFGLGRETWLAFLEHTSHGKPNGPEPQCSAKTRTGQPCRGYVHLFFGDPSGFVLGVHDRCPAHGGKRGL